MGFGERLKASREKLGYTLEYIEEETKIRKLYIDALENEKFEILPPRVYASGFVKRYARLLNLNDVELVAEFNHLAYGSSHIQDHEESSAREETIKGGEKIKIPVRNILAGAIFLLAVIWLSKYPLAYFSEKAKQHNENNTPPIQQSQNQNKPSSPLPAAGEPQENVITLDLKAVNNSWLNIIVDGQPQYTDILPAGESKSFTGQKSIYLKTGNAGGLDIKVDGHAIAVLGAPGAVVEKQFLVGQSYQ